MIKSKYIKSIEKDIIALTIEVDNELVTAMSTAGFVFLACTQEEGLDVCICEEYFKDIKEAIAYHAQFLIDEYEGA